MKINLGSIDIDTYKGEMTDIVNINQSKELMMLILQAKNKSKKTGNNPLLEVIRFITSPELDSEFSKEIGDEISKIIMVLADLSFDVLFPDA